MQRTSEDSGLNGDKRNCFCWGPAGPQASHPAGALGPSLCLSPSPQAWHDLRALPMRGSVGSSSGHMPSRAQPTPPARVRAERSLLGTEDLKTGAVAGRGGGAHCPPSAAEWGPLPASAGEPLNCSGFCLGSVPKGPPGERPRAEGGAPLSEGSASPRGGLKPHLRGRVSLLPGKALPLLPRQSFCG